MITLLQVPYSPYCIVQRHILESAGIRFRILNIPNGDRSLVWRLTKERYYQVPILRDGKSVLFETDDNSQILAKYLDDKFQLGLFPPEKDGLQAILWRYFENDIESFTFKINDTNWRQNVPKSDQLRFLRHKERKFGRGCLDLWAEERPALIEGLTQALVPCEQMLVSSPYLLGKAPLFVDFDLFGMLGNFLYSGQEKIPAAHTRLAAWHARMSSVKITATKREKLRS